ncbi:MAG: PAS domain S-box-containing protein [Sulfurimonas sp.]|jgi:PAS domain S-box-containing protein
MSNKNEEKSLGENVENSLKDDIYNYERLSDDQIKVMGHELQIHQIELQMQNDELRKTARELQQSKERYLNLYNKAPVGYLTLNKESIITDVNITTSELFGVDTSELLNKSFTNYIYNEDQDIYYLFRKSICEFNKLYSCELRITKRDGTYFWGHLKVSKELDNKSPIFLVVIHNISDRKKMEKELRDKDDMAIVQSRQSAMGEMISMIAHQWRQPIASIAMYANNLQFDLLFDNIITSDKLKTSFEGIQNQVAHLSKTIDDFRKFLDPNAEKTSIKVCTVLNETMKIIGKSLESNNIAVTLNSNCKSKIKVTSSELQHVFLNIINNAKDNLLKNKPKNASIAIDIKENDEYITIDICDNGSGIPQEILTKLGEPYVSSKGLNGTGLGIYMSKMILEKHMNGTLEWRNQEIGACFSISIKNNSK